MCLNPLFMWSARWAALARGCWRPCSPDDLFSLFGAVSRCVAASGGGKRFSDEACTSWSCSLLVRLRFTTVEVYSLTRGVLRPTGWLCMALRTPCRTHPAAHRGPQPLGRRVAEKMNELVTGRWVRFSGTFRRLRLLGGASAVKCAFTVSNLIVQ